MDREELVQLAKLTEELLKRYNFGFANVATPEEAAYEIFGIEGEPKARQKLRKKDFMLRAELDPDMYPIFSFIFIITFSLTSSSYRCFGLFDYFYCMLIKPIEEQVCLLLFLLTND